MKHLTLSFLIFCTLLANAHESSDSLNHYIQNFQFRKALQIINNLEENKENQFQKAMCYKALGESKPAIAILKSLSEKHPDDISIQTELAQSYERSSRWSDASNTYNNLIAIDTTNLYFSIKKSEAEINRKNYKNAIIDLEAIIKTDTLLNAVRLLGKSYETINNLDSAFYYYHMAWSTDSTDSFSAANLINIALKKKEYLAALALSQEYLKGDSTNKQINMLNGYTLYALEYYEDASIILEKCFMAGDSTTIVNRSLGMSFFYRGDSECAYEYLSRAYAQDSTNATILYNLAVSAGDIQKYDESIEYHSKLLDKLIPSDLQLYLNYRGVAIGREKKEDYENATTSYLKALEFASTNQRMDILYPLARIWEENLNNPAMATMYYNQYHEALAAHITYLENQELDREEINELNEKLTALKAHIIDLSGKEEIAIDKKKERQSQMDEILFVVNGEIADTPPPAKPISQKTIFDLNRNSYSSSDSIFVEKAKELKKKMLIILEIEEDKNDLTLHH